MSRAGIPARQGKEDVNDITARQPAGSPSSTGGQFAPSSRTETGTALHEPGPAAVLLDLAERAFPSAEDATYTSLLSRVQAQSDARAVLRFLTDDDFYDRHWFAIESAAMQHQRFANDTDGEEAAAASPADHLGVDLMDYYEINGPDRAGENSYGGYDFGGFAGEIADEWAATLKVRIAGAVKANDDAQAAASISAPAAA